MYIKIKVFPVDYGYNDGLARYEFAEVDDDFNEWPERDQERLINEVREEAVFNYVETVEEVCEGDLEEDEDY
jgi:hypothetical protein